LEAVKVFISYSHDSEAHKLRVRALAESLKHRGLHPWLDQLVFPPPTEGWPLWCEKHMRKENADFVLMICTADYRAGVEGTADPGKKRGVFHEAAIIRTEIYKQKANERFFPVLFDDAHEECVPLTLQQYHSFRLRDFEPTDPGYEDLLRVLTGQPGFVHPPAGPVPALPPRPFAYAPPSSASSPPPGYDIARIFAYAPPELIGREAETTVIARAWEKAAKGEAHPHVLTFVALGGEGKTSLVAAFANGLAAHGWAGCGTAFAWSFYRQGLSEQAGASSDLFFSAALAFFDLELKPGESGADKGRRLAGAVAARRALLILDGLEPLQYPPGSPLAGQLKDEAASALLKALATQNSGLCLVTTRFAIADLAGFAATAPQRPLPGLSDEGGAALLAALGVKGPDQDLRRLSGDVAGHPLTLEILGAYLKRAHGGDVARRDRVDLSKASAAKGDHAMRAMAAYATWLEGAGEAGARALALLRLMGLFDRAADAGCLEALWAAPPIPGLTEVLVGLDEEARNAALSDLEEARLLTVRSEGGAWEVDAHPLLRAYFARDLREARPEAAKAAHRRLYEHLKATPDKDAPTLEDLAPLYQAVTHGCAAELWQETCDEVYWKRICRGAEDYAVKKLGAYGADLGAVACFFAAPWRQASPHLTPAYQAWVTNLAGHRLRALGRLDEARAPMRAGLDMDVAREDWKNAAIAAGNLSQLELTLGGVAAAVRLGETAVAHADHSGDWQPRVAGRAAEADARHQAGEAAAAEALFAATEALQAGRPGQPPRLYSLRGYRYCDLKLGGAEAAAWRRLIAGPPRAPEPSHDALTAACAEVAARAREALAGAELDRELLDIGLDRLTLARAKLYAAVLRGEPSASDDADAAVAALRLARRQDHLPRPLLTRALQRAVVGNFAGARDDLDEAAGIAARGPMKLFQADIHLHRARLFGLLPNRPQIYPWTSPRDDLAAARKLIEACGYGRRREELGDAEAAYAALGGRL
jgi:hypothetical protein